MNLILIILLILLVGVLLNVDKVIDRFTLSPRVEFTDYNPEWHYIGYVQRQTPRLPDRMLLQRRMFAGEWHYRAMDLKTGKFYTVSEDTPVMGNQEWVLVKGRGLYYTIIE
jgi:hypothetical protein